MHPAIVYLEPFTVTGVFRDLTPETMRTIPEIWDDYGQRIAEIPAPDSGVVYGVGYVHGRGSARFYRYVAGRATLSEAVPVGMVRVEIPGGAYARFTYRGPISGLGQTVQRIFGAWLPAAKLQQRPGPELEHYDHRFRGEDEDSVMEFLVPVHDPAAAEE